MLHRPRIGRCAMTTAADLTAFLNRTGWAPLSTGSAGTMWTLGSAGARIAVPDQLAAGSSDWPGVVERVAAALGQDPIRVDFRIAHQNLDETQLRATHAKVIGETIPLAAGQSMVDSASRMLRAVATTARTQKANIGKYSTEGDRVFGLARMGHTQRGSYVIPVLMPVPEPEPAEPTMFKEMPAEPIERRTMRTFAEALTAVSRLVVEPAVTPRASIAAGLVTAGVSKQFLDALHTVVSQDAVESFGAQFSWAEALPAPVSAAVEMPHDAAPLISAAASHLAKRVIEPTQQITGPIVQYEHEYEADFGWIGVQTLRHGTLMVVRVHLSASDLVRARRYIDGKKTAVVLGVPQGGRGKTVQILEPKTFTSLDEIMFPAS